MLAFITGIYISARNGVQKYIGVQKSILLYILLHAIACNLEKSLILKSVKSN